MDVAARIKPLEPWPRLAQLLANWDPPDRPKLYRVLCGCPINGEHLCPQSFGELLPAALRGVARATKLRALDGLPPVKPSDWLLDHDGWYDLKDDGAYVVTRRRPRPVQPGWRHSLAAHYPVGRRELPEPVKRAAGYDSDAFPGLQFHIVGHMVALPATIIARAVAHVTRRSHRMTWSRTGEREPRRCAPSGPQANCRQNATFTVEHQVNSTQVWVALPLAYHRLCAAGVVTGAVPVLEEPDAWLTTLRRVVWAAATPSASAPVLPAFRDRPFLALLTSGDPTGLDRVFDDRYFMASAELNLLNAILFVGDADTPA